MTYRRTPRRRAGHGSGFMTMTLIASRSCLLNRSAASGSRSRYLASPRRIRPQPRPVSQACGPRVPLAIRSFASSQGTKVARPASISSSRRSTSRSQASVTAASDRPSKLSDRRWMISKRSDSLRDNACARTKSFVAGVRWIIPDGSAIYQTRCDEQSDASSPDARPHSGHRSGVARRSYPHPTHRPTRRSRRCRPRCHTTAQTTPPASPSPSPQSRLTRTSRRSRPLAAGAATYSNPNRS